MRLEWAAKARQLLAALAAAAERQSWPARPVAERPRRELSPREESHWAYKASTWEACRRREIEADLRGPIASVKAMISWPCRRRYARRARELIEQYRTAAREAGWEI